MFLQARPSVKWQCAVAFTILFITPCKDVKDFQDCFTKCQEPGNRKPRQIFCKLIWEEDQEIGVYVKTIKTCYVLVLTLNNDCPVLQTCTNKNNVNRKVTRKMR